MNINTIGSPLFGCLRLGDTRLVDNDQDGGLGVEQGVLQVLRTCLAGLNNLQQTKKYCFKN